MLYYAKSNTDRVRSNQGLATPKEVILLDRKQTQELREKLECLGLASSTMSYNMVIKKEESIRVTSIGLYSLRKVNHAKHVNW